jgi:hypothetical protein
MALNRPKFIVGYLQFVGRKRPHTPRSFKSDKKTDQAAVHECIAPVLQNGFVKPSETFPGGGGDV